MKRPRTPRTHDRAIEALRAAARRAHTSAQAYAPGTVTAQYWMDAAALSYAAEFLADITGVVERKPAARKKVRR